jgi:hypothetical protein
VSEMINPVDGWILGHSLVGFFLGRLKFSRHIFYPLTIIWEVYQLYFHYQPQGYSLADVWQNSLVDILAGIGFYEFGVWYSRRERQLIPRIRMNTNTKWMMAHILISCGISWVFWDDMIRREMLTEIPLPQIPLLLGACLRK